MAALHSPTPLHRERLGPSGVLLLLLLALLPSWGTLGVPFLAEDASILGRMSHAGPLDDWIQAQYGIEHVVRFWRPMVSDTWWLQAKLLGTEAWPARALALGLHALSALLLGQLLLALGSRRSGALLGGALAASFLHQGGAVTWLAGRTDVMVAAGMLMALLSAARGRTLWAAVFAFGAVASKEFAFLLPFWMAVLFWARGWSAAEIRRVVLPTFVACVLAYAWRTLVLGAWDGGYAGGGSNFAKQLLPGLGHLAQGAWPQLAAAAALLALGAWRGSLHWRLAVAGFLCALSAALPIVPLAAALPLEAANQRLTLVLSIGLAIAMGASLARKPRGGQSASLPLLWTLPLLAWSSWQAFEDTHQWARAADLAGQEEARVRALLEDLEVADLPVLVADIPVHADGAYCLGLGVADRFRAPFEPTPRPVWPLRPIFEVNLKKREPVRELVGGALLLPFRAQPRVPLMEWSADLPANQDWLDFDARIFPSLEDLSPKLTFQVPELGQPAWLEIMVYTELGYGSIHMGLSIDVAGAQTLSLRELIQAVENGRDLSGMLIHAADLGGAQRAYLELRLLDDRDQLLAASPWIETRWAADFLASVGA